MKVLLTGASGFVGSHILDVLCEREVPTVLLLRNSSSRRFIEPHLPRVELRFGSLEDSASLKNALAGVTHVVHCAGIIKARHRSEFDRINVGGTRWIVEAVNAHRPSVRRLVYISSVAAGGPGTSSAPMLERNEPRPVSAYGRSKLASELEVSRACSAEYVIVRPAAVYGPRDTSFLSLFKAVNRGFAPRFGRHRQELNLVYVRDLAEIVVTLLSHDGAGGLTVNVACPEVVTGDQLCDSIAAVLGVRIRELTIPLGVVRLVCWIATAASAVTRSPSIIGLDKYRELTAPGWVCDTTRLTRELRLECPTRLQDGIQATAKWYREHGWV